MTGWRHLAVEIVAFLRGGVATNGKRTLVEESLVEAWERRIRILDRDVPVPLPRYRHTASGGEYDVITDACVERDPDTTVVVYRSRATGKVWVRPHAEFHGQIIQGDKLVPRFTRIL